MRLGNCGYRRRQSAVWIACQAQGKSPDVAHWPGRASLNRRFASQARPGATLRLGWNRNHEPARSIQGERGRRGNARRAVPGNRIPLLGRRGDVRDGLPSEGGPRRQALAEDASQAERDAGRFASRAATHCCGPSGGTAPVMFRSTRRTREWSQEMSVDLDKTCTGRSKSDSGFGDSGNQVSYGPCIRATSFARCLETWFPDDLKVLARRYAV